MAFNDRKNELEQVPILTFWQIDEIRIVDYGDEDLESTVTPGTIRFDGQDYVPGHLSAGSRSESIEGGERDLTVVIEDPFGAIAAALQDVDGLADTRVTVRSIAADQLATPSESHDEFFICRAPTCTEAGIAFLLGSPAQVEIQCPRKRFARSRCWNTWERRHEFRNLCSYPSDWFTERTKQQFKTFNVIAGETVWKYGWRTLNANFATEFGVGQGLSPAGGSNPMRIELGVQNAWNDGDRDGPFAYKLIDGDFDLETTIAFDASSRDDLYAGILCQDVADETSWVSITYATTDGHSPGGSPFTRFRKTLSDVSTDTESGLELGATFRLERVGDVFTAYRLDGSTWTVHHSETIALGSSVRIGLMVGTDAGPSGPFLSSFDHFWFHKGGETECDRTEPRCVFLNNSNDFNGFPRMGDARERV